MDGNVQLCINAVISGAKLGIVFSFIIWFTAWTIPQLVQFFKKLTR